MEHQVIALGRVCTACGKERKAKNLKYEPTTFKAYCDNPYICSPEHPNAPKNLIERGGELDLVDYAVIDRLYKNHLNAVIKSDERIQKLYRLLDKPLTLRIQDPDQALFLLELDEELKFNNMSEVVRYCIDQMRENRGEYYKDKKLVFEAKVKEEKAEEALRELENTPNNVPKPSADDEGMVF